MLKIISLSHLFQNRGLINYAHKEGENLYVVDLTTQAIAD